MIYTGCFDRFDPGDLEFNTFSIAMDRGKLAGYTGEVYEDFIPHPGLYYRWKEDRKVKDPKEADREFIERYYNAVLKNKNAEKLYNKFDESLILCYEDYYKFSYRHVVADWFELMLNEKVPEIEMIDGKAYQLRRPAYIKEMLTDVIKEDNVKVYRKR